VAVTSHRESESPSGGLQMDGVEWASRCVAHTHTPAPTTHPPTHPPTHTHTHTHTHTQNNSLTHAASVRHARTLLPDATIQPVELHPQSCTLRSVVDDKSVEGADCLERPTPMWKVRQSQAV
jgi:hypothetical protein